MKSIILNGPAVDNAGQYCQPGDTLTISDEAKHGAIKLAAATLLVESCRALAKGKAAAADDAPPPAA